MYCFPKMYQNNQFEVTLKDVWLPAGPKTGVVSIDFEQVHNTYANCDLTSKQRVQDEYV